MKIELMGCSEDIYELISSALMVKHSTKKATEIWDEIKTGSINGESVQHLVARQVGRGLKHTIRQIQFIFVLNHVSRGTLSLVDRYRVGPLRQFETSSDWKNRSIATPPSFSNRPTVLKQWRRLRHEIEKFRSLCLETGIPPEDANYILPMGVTSREQLSVSFQTLQLFLDENLCENRHWEIRNVADQMYNLAKDAFPSLAPRIGCKCWENRKLCCDETIDVYKKCGWNSTRPHREELEKMFSHSRTEETVSA